MKKLAQAAHHRNTAKVNCGTQPTKHIGASQDNVTGVGYVCFERMVVAKNSCVACWQLNCLPAGGRSTTTRGGRTVDGGTPYDRSRQTYHCVFVFEIPGGYDNLSRTIMI
jgi:hypothetical protein